MSEEERHKHREKEIDVPSEEDKFEEDSEKLQMVSHLHDQSSSDIVRKVSVFAVDKRMEMPQVQKIRIPYLKPLSEICQFAKKLRNRAVFLGSQLFLLRYNCKVKIKDKYCTYSLVTQYPDLAILLLEFMKYELDSPEMQEELRKKLYDDPSLIISKKLFNKLKIFEYSNPLIKFLKFDERYKKLDEIYSQLPIQVLRNVASEWKSYRRSHKNWEKNPDLYEAEPQRPGYKRKNKEYLLTFPGVFVNNKKYASSIVDRFYSTRHLVRNLKRLQNNKYMHNKKRYAISGNLTLPQKFLNNFPLTESFPIIRTTIDIQSIVEVKIVSKNSHYEIQVVYRVPKTEYPSLNTSKAYSIDIGVNNLIALTNNFGEQPLLIRGKLVKSINQWMNKKIGILRSVQTQGMIFEKGDELPETKEMARIRNKRNSIIEDYFHKVSRFVINRCLDRGVKNLAIGYNAGWKKEVEMSKKSKQNFVYIPFFKLIEMIKYKAELVGINVVRVGESHTSKCSAIDFEPIKHHETYLGQRGLTIIGKNKKKKIETGESEYKYYKARGLFRTRDGYIVHSDVNASYNIGRRAFPDLFNEYTLSKKCILQSPIVFNIYEYKKGIGISGNKLKPFIRASCALS